MSFKKFAAAEKTVKENKPTEAPAAAPLTGPRVESTALENPVTPTDEQAKAPPAPAQGS